MSRPTQTEPTDTTDATVHPTAIVEGGATLHPGVTVGPRCIVGAGVTLHTGACLIADAHITGNTEIGADTIIYPYACVGFGPQHIKITPNDPMGGVRIGAGCTLREHTTVHAAMHPGAHTVLGDRNYLMVASHVGHDSVLGDDVIVCNGSVIAGHCEIHDNAYISGNVSVHQFCRVGRGAMLSGNNGTSVDVPPYAVLVSRNTLAGLNLIGMRRAGIPRDQITLAREAYRRALRGRRTRADQLAVLDELGQHSEPVRLMAEFVRGATRGIAVGRTGTSRNDEADHGVA